MVSLLFYDDYFDPHKFFHLHISRYINSPVRYNRNTEKHHGG